MTILFLIIVWVFCLKFGVYDLFFELFSKDAGKRKIYFLDEFRQIKQLKNMDEMYLRRIAISPWTIGFIVYSTILFSNYYF